MKVGMFETCVTPISVGSREAGERSKSHARQKFQFESGRAVSKDIFLGAHAARHVKDPADLSSLFVIALLSRSLPLGAMLRYGCWPSSRCLLLSPLANHPTVALED